MVRNADIKKEFNIFKEGFKLFKSFLPMNDDENLNMMDDINNEFRSLKQKYHNDFCTNYSNMYLNYFKNKEREPEEKVIKTLNDGFIMYKKLLPIHSSVDDNYWSNVVQEFSNFRLSHDGNFCKDYIKVFMSDFENRARKQLHQEIEEETR